MMNLKQDELIKAAEMGLIMVCDPNLAYDFPCIIGAGKTAEDLNTIARKSYQGLSYSFEPTIVSLKKKNGGYITAPGVIVVLGIHSSYGRVGDYQEKAP